MSQDKRDEMLVDSVMSESEYGNSSRSEGNQITHGEAGDVEDECETEVNENGEFCQIEAVLYGDGTGMDGKTLTSGIWYVSSKNVQNDGNYFLIQIHSVYFSNYSDRKIRVPTCEVTNQDVYISKTCQFSNEQIMKFCMRYHGVAVLIGYTTGHCNSNRELHQYKKIDMEGPLKKAANLDCVTNAVVCAVCNIRGEESDPNVVPD